MIARRGRVCPINGWTRLDRMRRVMPKQPCVSSISIREFRIIQKYCRLGCSCAILAFLESNLSVLHALAPDNLQNRLEDDPQVQGKGLALQVPLVKLNLGRDGQFVAVGAVQETDDRRQSATKETIRLLP